MTDLIEETKCKYCEKFGGCFKSHNPESTCSEFSKKSGITETIVSTEIEEILSVSKKPIQRLGQGIHNGIFYYGTNFLIRGKSYSGIVTSDRKIYLAINKHEWECKNCGTIVTIQQHPREKPNPPKTCTCSFKNFIYLKTSNSIKDEFGLNYRTEMNEDSLDYVWQTEDIRDYINKIYTKRTIKELYDKLYNLNKKYIDHLNDSSHKFVACWIIGTYCYTLFEQFGRLYFKAEKGSGKTKQSRITKFSCFNPLWITKGTESYIFRDAEANCGTYLLDNMDKLHEDLKRTMEHLIETGWMWDATYRLTNKDTGRTEKFMSYCPMALNNILGLDENTIDKTFEIPMLKSVNINIKRTKPTNKSEDWNELRRDIRNYVLDNWQDIAEVYKTINANFSGREFDVVEGVLTIAKLVGEDVYTELESYVSEKLQEEYIDLENNTGYLVFTEIWNLFEDEPLLQETNVFVGSIADKLFTKFNPNCNEIDYDNKKKGFSKYIAKIIRTVPMFRKSGLSQGRTYITIKRKELIQYMKLQRFLDINESANLPVSTTSTTSTKLLTPTQISKVGDLDSQVDKVEIKIVKPEDAFKE